MVDAITFQKTFDHRKAALVKVLRVCQVSIELGSFNAAVAILAGLRSV